MPELRWTLLILGALFIGGLAIWEWRRQRYARGPAPDMSASHSGAAGGRDGERISPTFDGSSGDVSFGDGAPGLNSSRSSFREPTLTFPEVSLEVPADSRDRFADPPVIELDDESLDRLKVAPGEAVDEFSESVDVDDALADDASADDELAEDAAAAEPMLPKLAVPVAAPTLAPLRESVESRDSQGARRARDLREQVRVHDQNEVPEREMRDEPTTRFSASEESDTASAAAPTNPDSLDDAEPVVEWPDEDVRKIIALRLVSGTGERFAGRAVRLALTAEGFLLGKFEIFHKPGPDARAVLSAASLTKPGTFSLATIDAQRFGGLSLFAVLPGPLSPLATFDELLSTARSLNDRLRGALQDERGEPLTPVRSQNMRDSLSASSTAAAPVVGAAATPPVVGGGSGDATHA
jgi:FtsZ-interacting cell division protein ZipA